MKIWAISDTHFNHSNIIKYCNRPFKDVEDMNRQLIANWNKVVAPDDVVIHCGDLLLGRTSELENIVSQLNGRKFLVLGNHDHFKASRAERAGFLKVDYGFLFMIIDDEKYMFSHRPIHPALISDDTNYIFGHVHTKIDPIEQFDNVKCVCVERNNYEPFLIVNDFKKLLCCPHEVSPDYDFDHEYDKLYI